MYAIAGSVLACISSLHSSDHRRLAVSLAFIAWPCHGQRMYCEPTICISQAPVEHTDEYNIVKQGNMCLGPPINSLAMHTIIANYA